MAMRRANALRGPIGPTGLSSSSALSATGFTVHLCRIGFAVRDDNSNHMSSPPKRSEERGPRGVYVLGGPGSATAVRDDSVLYKLMFLTTRHPRRSAAQSGDLHSRYQKSACDGGSVLFASADA
ncbi:hypothetical protein PbB2_01132 [Candidatus Phycosocius bacilliformis]|uniref:Uncharacterized protein n=1 Tax=Candidatus Phycosocius bacilliformis TaxID=1445552 RepID=A0A2P2E8T5_9PROT|nr:hypothetical protein PbB2_01132 [Candidatus Phycosocius bacilliformis]